MELLIEVVKLVAGLAFVVLFFRVGYDAVRNSDKQAAKQEVRFDDEITRTYRRPTD